MSPIKQLSFVSKAITEFKSNSSDMFHLDSSHLISFCELNN